MSVLQLHILYPPPEGPVIWDMVDHDTSGENVLFDPGNPLGLLPNPDPGGRQVYTDTQGGSSVWEVVPFDRVYPPGDLSALDQEVVSNIVSVPEVDDARSELSEALIYYVPLGHDTDETRPEFHNAKREYIASVFDAAGTLPGKELDPPSAARFVILELYRLAFLTKSLLPEDRSVDVSVSFPTDTVIDREIGLCRLQSATVDPSVNPSAWIAATALGHLVDLIKPIKR